MSSVTSGSDLSVGAGSQHSKPTLDQPTTAKTVLTYLGVIALGLGFVAWSIFRDLEETGAPIVTYLPFVLLGVALLIALGFEFVNGFHDTANAVATVIYTHSLPANIAVVWSGMFNFLGVLVSSGAVAFSVVSLLPVELILQVGHGAGFAMVFALLISAILWNLSTWWFGLPASSSHTLIGSIIGVGLANQLMSPKSGTSGVDWAQAGGVFRALLISPLVGFGFAFLLLLLFHFAAYLGLHLGHFGKLLAHTVLRISLALPLALTLFFQHFSRCLNLIL